MITDYGFVLARGDKGFRHFLKYTLFEAEKCISNFESNGISRTLERPDNYVIAKRIKSLYVEYMDGLKEAEKPLLIKLDMARSGMRNMRVSMVVYIRFAIRNGKRSSSEETYTAISANYY